jgi:hypothetical protein
VIVEGLESDRLPVRRSGVEHPVLEIRRLENMAVGLTGTLRRVTREPAATSRFLLENTAILANCKFN